VRPWAVQSKTGLAKSKLSLLAKGYRRLWGLLRQEGWLINASTRLYPKGVCRLYFQQRSSLRHKSKKSSMASCFPIFSLLTAINQQWR
jgi:hypothetical protein